MKCDIPWDQWPNTAIFDEYIGTKKEFGKYLKDNSEPPFGTFEFLESHFKLSEHDERCVSINFHVMVTVPKVISNQLIYQLQKNGWKLTSNQLTGKLHREYSFMKQVTVRSMKLRYQLQEREEPPI